MGGDNLPETNVLSYLREQANRFSGEIVGANLQYDLDFLAEDGIKFRQVKAFRDIQVAEPLIDELQMSYSLNRIAETWDEGQKNETLFNDACNSLGIAYCDRKKYLWKLPAKYVGPYAEEDAAMPLRILAKQEIEIERQNLHEVWNLESACLPVLVKMRRRGVKFDADKLAKIERFAIAEETKALSELHRKTGVKIKQGDTMKINAVVPALFAVGVKLPKTATGKWSVTKELMENIDHPVGAILRRARKMSQLRTTFVNSIRRHAVGNRIHCTFNQLRRQTDDGSSIEGAAYGRLSCSNPNLQQQPVRDEEIGPMWRSIYVADRGALWAQLDYSQQEPRMLLHFALLAGSCYLGGEASKKALEAQSRFIKDPKTDNHTMFTRLVYGDNEVNEMLALDSQDAGKRFKIARDRCKNIFLGICYGMGGPKLCRSINLPVILVTHHKSGKIYERAGPEGQAMMDKVDNNVPYVRAMARFAEQRAKKMGYIKTLSGRRCRFPTDNFGNFDWTHKGLNRLIQGSAADQTKKAMADMDRAGIPLQLQVHDEFDFSVENKAQAELGAELMRNTYDLSVPSKVDVGLGPSWGEIKE